MIFTIMIVLCAVLWAQSLSRTLSEMILMTAICFHTPHSLQFTLFTKTTVLLLEICSFTQKLLSSDTRSSPAALHFLHSWNISYTHQANDQKSAPKKLSLFYMLFTEFYSPLTKTHLTYICIIVHPKYNFKYYFVMIYSI